MISQSGCLGHNLPPFTENIPFSTFSFCRVAKTLLLPNLPNATCLTSVNLRQLPCYQPRLLSQQYISAHWVAYGGQRAAYGIRLSRSLKHNDVSLIANFTNCWNSGGSVAGSEFVVLTLSTSKARTLADLAVKWSRHTVMKSCIWTQSQISFVICLLIHLIAAI